MPKNYLIPAFIQNIKPKRNNFFLGLWCHEINSKNIFKNFNKLNTFKYHWEDKQKLKKDFIFLKKLNENLFKKLYKVLNKLHNLDRSQEYWRIIIYPWLVEYTAVIYDRWETVRLFEKKNNRKSFYLIDNLPKDFNSGILDHADFTRKSSLKHHWNHSIFLRVFKFKKNPKIKSLKLSENSVKEEKVKKKFLFGKNFLDYFLSYLTIKYNKIVFDSFYFPKVNFVNLCIKNFLIPYKINNFFIIVANKLNADERKRELLRNLISAKSKKKNFNSFLINSIHDDLPEIYVENFLSFLQRIKKFTKKKKIIFSMMNIINNDYFKIFVSETKRFGSKLIISDHGGGLKYKTSPLEHHYEKICEKFINWDNRVKKNFLLSLSPSLEIITKKKLLRNPKYFTVLFWESSKYPQRIQSTPYFSEDVKDFKNLIYFIKTLKKNVINKIKFRLKSSQSINSDKIFKVFFGQSKIDKNNSKSSYYSLLKNSRLVLLNYPTTALSETLYLNIPSILVCKREIWNFNKLSLKTFYQMKKQKMVFENYSDAKSHIENIFNDVDKWWNKDSVQEARNKYLKNFFNVKNNWENDWNSAIKKLNNSF